MRSRFPCTVGAVAIFACAPKTAESYIIPVSGLPSVTVDAGATLTPGDPAPLSSLLTYNPGNPQCEDTNTGTVGPCSFASVLINPNPGSNYAISGG